MKPFFLHTGLYALLFWSLLSACQPGSKEATDAAADSLALNDPIQNELNSNQSQLLEEIFSNSTEGSVRGISIGDEPSKVKALETYEMFEESADHLGYTHETDQHETIDIQYHLSAAGVVNKIEIDVYLNSPEATKQLWESGKNYFTDKYGAGTDQQMVYQWNESTMTVLMEDVTKGKDFGLKFLFAPRSKQALAHN
ncbi:hypothetical protein CLV98_102391 [Dyadobacter jejuensis]|uniref:Lipoprotein n=1 Tax=Dyadobacter jejuensis TaxID=1082580 RepID=A0A316BAI5_9BACT|nr:hypothetical protein [Dyadobacter jejuensis]PWJ59557.1 hypothetical protein CLV98_102391 [Dyadobacter jejuensis]